MVCTTCPAVTVELFSTTQGVETAFGGAGIDMKIQK